MDIIYFLIIIFLIGFALFLFLKNRELENKNKNNKFLDYRLQREEKKQQNKRQIIEILEKKGRITNQEVEKALKVSDATATRYLDELEKEGRVIQKGEAKGTYYVKKQ